MPNTASIVQSYTATRGLAITRLATGDLSVVAHDGGADVNLTLTQAEAEPFAAVIMDVPPPPPGGGGEPSPANVVFLSEFNLPDGSTTAFPDETGRHAVGGMYPGLCQIKVENGEGSLWSYNTIGATISGNRPDFDLSAANSDKFTIDYELVQTDAASVYHVLSNGKIGLRHAGPDLQFAWFDSNGVHREVRATNVGWTPNVKQSVRVNKNAEGKIRLFIGGVMKKFDTPANSAIQAATGDMGVNVSGAGQQSRLNRLRIVKGDCLHDSDANYTP